MVRGQAPLQSLQPGGEPQREQVLIGDVSGGGQDGLADLPPFLRCGEPEPGLQALLNRLIAAGPTEQKVDARQQIVLLKPSDDLASPRSARAARPPSASAI